MFPFFALLCSLLLAAVHGDIVLFPWTGNDGSFGNAVDAQIGFGNTQPISTDCVSALNQTVTCDPQMQLLAATGYVISLGDTSSGLCTPSCNSSLVAYRGAVTAACGASGAFDTYPTHGEAISSTTTSTRMQVCDKDPSTGEYCPQWLKKRYAANGNPKLEDLPDSVLCSHCQINNMRAVQNSVFLGYNGPWWRPTAGSLPVRCNVGAASTPKPPPEDTFPNTADGANRTCLSGSTYMSQAGDTCHSIALASSLAEDTLASINDLGVNCSRMTVGTTPECYRWHVVVSGDTCALLQNTLGITMAQLVAWNPDLLPDCSNLLLGGAYCVQGPRPSPVTITTTTTPTTASTPTTTPTPQIQQLPAWTYQACYTDADPRLLPIPKPASGAMTPSTCAQLYCGHAYLGVENGEECWCGDSLDTSQQAASEGECGTPCVGDGEVMCGGEWRITVYKSDAEVVGWEYRDCFVGDEAKLLAVGKGVRGDMTPGVCAGLCEGYRFLGVENGEQCWCGNGFDVSKRAAAGECGTSCVGDGEVVCGGGWRISVYEDVDGDGVGSAGCGATPTATTTSPSSTTSTTLPPTPSSTGTDCAQTYTVQSGDWCAKIWETFGLSESELCALNPSLNAGCDLVVGQVLCVAAPSDTCNATYTVVSGDWCSKIWDQFGLTEAQFRALNPGLDANCVINVGQRLCVG
ncbi:carbohydrate-binding module family 50 protein [Parathielavia hyrcaniae]|uniref:Carbohydrate-binding module family 50 protein n=1 Tax=Parathielavia hyrcaniae TaxID=113614 RepID=A0AAN6PRP4_9PEZI|nr:carbohydrate-binding module family 50 protein [Parathielavia hyrcaniae]